MLRLFGLSAYAAQSVATLVSVVVVARLLGAAEYATYSVVVATAQLGGAVLFEWIRITAGRFYPAADEADTRRRLATLLGAFAATAALVVVAGAALAAFGPWPAALAGAGAAITLLLGLSELQLTLVRYRGELEKVSWLQIARGALLLVATVAGAASTRTAAGGLAGLVTGLAVSVLGVLLADGASRRASPADFRLMELRRMAPFGAGAAAASSLHAMAPVVVRWIVISRWGLSEAAGLSLAMDLLQRPFSVAATAVQGVLYPEARLEYDRRPAGPHPALARLYTAQLASVTFAFAAAWALIPEAARLLAPVELRAGFLEAAPALAAFLAVHSWLQNTVAIPAHLLHRSGRLMRNGAAELALVWAGALGALGLGGSPGAVAAGALAGAAAAFAFAAPLLALVPVRFPARALYAAAVIAAAALPLGLWVLEPVWAGIGVKSVVLSVGAALLMRSINAGEPSVRGS